jgi:N4-gp56 family major capsid protein
MAFADYGSISPRTGVFATAQLLKRAENQIVLPRVMQSHPMPKNKSDTVKFRRYSAFAAATTPLTEGVKPTGKTISFADFTAQLKQYGDFVEITDKIADLHEDPVLKEMMAVCGEQAGETIEKIAFGVATGGTNVFYANGTARNQVNTVLTRDKLRAVVRSLRANGAKPISDILGSTEKFNTENVGEAFFAFGHTDLDSDIRNITGFVPVENYGQSAKAMPYEIGKVENVRFILTRHFGALADAGGAKGTMVSATGTNADVYQIVVLGKDAMGSVALKGADSVHPMVLNPNTPRGGDPLGQLGSVGWKTWYAAVRLNEAWMARIECSVTAL